MKRRKNRIKSKHEKIIADILYDMCYCGSRKIALEKNGVAGGTRGHWRTRYSGLIEAQDNAIKQAKSGLSSLVNVEVLPKESSGGRIIHLTIIYILWILIFLCGFGVIYYLKLRLAN